MVARNVKEFVDEVCARCHQHFNTTADNNKNQRLTLRHWENDNWGGLREQCEGSSIAGDISFSPKVH